MRSIRSLDDAQIALREIYQKIDRMESRMADYNQRRITNVAPSIHENDVVVRKELDDLRKASEDRVSAVGSGNLVTILFSFTSVPAVAQLSSPPFICKRAYKPISVSIAAVNPPTVAAAQFQLRRNNSNLLLSSNLTMPLNTPQLEVLSVTNFVDPNLQWSFNDTVVIETVVNGGISKFTIAVLARKF